MRFTFSLAWRDLRAGSRALWIFCACLALGVALIAATGGLFQQVRGALLADTRALFGGDIEVHARVALGDEELAWMRARGEVSLLVELRTMLRTADGRTQLVELQSADDRYPLYGAVALQPAAPLAEALALRDGRWGAAIDPALAQQLQLKPGDTLKLGALELVVRALIAHQPDRSLRADWRGQPVMVAAEALRATQLVQPASRASYRYRVKTAEDPLAWRRAFTAAFPDAPWQVRVFAERTDRVAEVLAKVGSGLLLIGFSALFIGGLGVFNSIHAYLEGKLGTLATLRALGLRDRRLAAVYLCQVLMLAGGASLAGAAIGGVLALAGATMAAGYLPAAPGADAADLRASALAAPLALAWLLGVLTALSFALPPLGRALSVSPAALFRGLDSTQTRTPAAWWKLSALAGAFTIALTLAVVPEPWFAALFILATALLLVLLEGLVRLLRAQARRLAAHRLFAGRFALRLALANLHRPGSPLRLSLLSLGSSLTLLVACALVVAALLRTLNDTVPEQAPTLVFHDLPAPQLDEFRGVMKQSTSLARLEVAPLVLGRLAAVNGEVLKDSTDARRALEARDEHKLSYRANDFDQLVVERGAWWPQDYLGPTLVAMEDREADQLGLKVGDRLRFDIMGTAVEAQLAAIYAQRRFRSQFWFEAIFTDGTLEPHITRYVGTAYMDPAEAIAAQARVAAAMPAVVTVRTEGILREARRLLARASAGLAVIAGISLVASLLVLASVIAASRAQQVYDASMLHALGARLGLIRRSLRMEYALLALVTSAFATVFGSARAFSLLEYRLQLGGEIAWWLGAATAIAVSGLSLGAGAQYLLRQLRLSPALLLREAA